MHISRRPACLFCQPSWENADELIRQVTLDSPERGLLCLRVRDEIRMTIDAYKTLYDSSITFGVNKQLQTEEGMSTLEEKVTTTVVFCRKLIHGARSEDE